MKKHATPLIIALVVVAGAVAFAAGAVASVPGANGVIHGCSARKGGQVRVIDTATGQKCVKGERILNWNQRGQRGLKGAQGVRGLQGKQGVQGVPGPSAQSITHVVASFTPATDSFSIASWTQPANTIAYAYWRVNVTTPGGSCVSAVAAHVGKFGFLLNGADADRESQSVDMGPAETQTFPAVGSHQMPNSLNPLLPGDYQLKTDMVDPYLTVPAADCGGTVVQTEVFIETVGV